MAHHSYEQPCFHQDGLRQRAPTRRPRPPVADMSSRLPPPGNLAARDLWHDLNEELSQNVEREFPAHRQQPKPSMPIRFEEFNIAETVKQEPRDEMFCSSQAPSRGGYMQRSSPFSLDSPHGEMSFMEWYPRGDATITYPNESGEIESISHLNPNYFEDRCPLLAQAFEYSRTGPKLFLEILTPATATPFIRYLYTGSYAIPGRESTDVYEDVPTSVLLHCQIFQLADIYDLPDLKQQAYVNVTRQCEFGCSSPYKPIDLCEAIKYVYQHLREHTNLIETIICYCVTCFLKHRLDNDFEFRTMAFDLRDFQKDLVGECRKRQFEDDTATAIINLPFKPYMPETYASREDLTPGRGDVVYHFHASDDYEGASKKRKRPEMAGPGTSAIALALRQKREARTSKDKEEPGSDVEDLGIGSSKRRASMVKQDFSTSDSEFEVVPAPAPVQELSSDSDSDGEPVIVERPGQPVGSQPRDLPVRPRSVASSVTLVEREAQHPRPDSADSDSEADWTLV